MNELYPQATPECPAPQRPGAGKACPWLLVLCGRQSGRQKAGDRKILTLSCGGQARTPVRGGMFPNLAKSAGHPCSLERSKGRVESSAEAMAQHSQVQVPLALATSKQGEEMGSSTAKIDE